MKSISSIQEKIKLENLLSTDEGANYRGRYFVVILRRTGWFLRDLFTKGKFKWRDDAYILKRIYAGHNDISADLAKKWGATRPSTPPECNTLNSPPISEILPGLYLGRLGKGIEDEGAESAALINRLGIKTIITCLQDQPYSHEGVQLLHLPHLDGALVDITPFFAQSFATIEESLKSGNKVLVHCAAGVSRSASQVIAYLIRKHGMSYNQALTHVRSIRPCVLPNWGFVQKLEAFAERLKNPPAPPSQETDKSLTISHHQNVERCLIDGNMEELHRVLDRKLINALNHKEESLLHILAMKDNMPREAVWLFGKRGANFNLQDSIYKNTPLHWAIANANNAMALEIVKVGKNFGLNPNITSRAPRNLETVGRQRICNTALHLAVAKGYKDKDTGGAPLSVSNYQLAEELLKSGADPSIPDDIGNTPLHLAYLRRDQAMIALLERHGASKNAVNKAGETPPFQASKTLSQARQILYDSVTFFFLDESQFSN